MTSRTLRRRLAHLLIPIGLGVFFGVVTVTISVARVHTAQSRVTADIFHAHAVSSQLTQTVLLEEAAFRNYALTGGAEFLEDYRAARGRSTAVLRQLAELDLLDGVDRQQNVGHNIEAWRAAEVEPTLATVAANGPLDPRQVPSDQRDLVAAKSALRGYQDALLDERRRSVARLNGANRALFAVLAVGVLLLALGGVALWSATRRWVLLPLERLGAEVDRVHGGELSHQVTVADAPIEITALAEQIDRMRMRILEEYAQVLQARQAATDAYRLIEEQAEDLQRSNAELEQFAYVASHDLQEPLRKVASFCQLLERRYGDQLDERGVQYIEFAVDGAKRMQQLINDLLSFSRVGRITNTFAPVDLEDVLAQALRQLEVLLADSGASVTHDRLPTVEGDESLLVQLFQNLVGNAVKFRAEPTPLIHIGARQDSDHWEFCCTDNGIGIEPQYADKIFVIFQRLHSRDAYGGTGIGLALCKKIVEHHEGTMWLDTEMSGGATIRWTLPISARATRATIDTTPAGAAAQADNAHPADPADPADSEKEAQ